jgi:hypothetical protein
VAPQSCNHTPIMNERLYELRPDFGSGLRFLFPFCRTRACALIPKLDLRGSGLGAGTSERRTRKPASQPLAVIAIPRLSHRYSPWQEGSLLAIFCRAEQHSSHRMCHLASAYTSREALASDNKIDSGRVHAGFPLMEMSGEPVPVTWASVRCSPIFAFHPSQAAIISFTPVSRSP